MILVGIVTILLWPEETGHKAHEVPMAIGTQGSLSFEKNKVGFGRLLYVALKLRNVLFGIVQLIFRIVFLWL